jgi:hypothetical protein
MSNFLSTLNYSAILVSGAAYWLLGSIWFSLIAGKAWTAELIKHGVIIKPPAKGEFATKLVTTFILNTLVAFGIAIIIRFIDMNGALPGFKLGLLIGVTLLATTIGVIYTWEGRSLKLFIIDVLYPTLGVIICSVILASWR